MFALIDIDMVLRTQILYPGNYGFAIFGQRYNESLDDI